MKVTIIPIVIRAFGPVTKGLLKGLEIRGQVETEETFCHSDSSERPSANAHVKNSQGVKMKIIIKYDTSAKIEIFYEYYKYVFTQILNYEQNAIGQFLSEVQLIFNSVLLLRD